MMALDDSPAPLYPAPGDASPPWPEMPPLIMAPKMPGPLLTMSPRVESVEPGRGVVLVLAPPRWMVTSEPGEMGGLTLVDGDGVGLPQQPDRCLGDGRHGSLANRASMQNDFEPSAAISRSGGTIRNRRFVFSLHRATMQFDNVHRSLLFSIRCCPFWQLFFCNTRTHHTIPRAPNYSVTSVNVIISEKLKSKKLYCRFSFGIYA